MATQKRDIKKEILRDEIEFIGLLLHHKDLVGSWIDSDLPIEYFEEEHHRLLQEITNAYDEGFLLTRKTFKQAFKTTSIPKERIRSELAFNRCYSNKGQKGDYVGLEKKIKDWQ